MKWRNPILLGVLVFAVQFFLSEYLMIRRIRPDFILVFIMYIGIRYGSMSGVIVGFVFGLLEDLLGAGSLLGLAPLTKSITGFLMGRLSGKFQRMNPVTFHFLWVLVVLVHFGLYIYVRSQGVYESSQSVFWKTWFFSTLYTLVFIGIFQVIMPFHRIQTQE